MVVEIPRWTNAKMEVKEFPFGICIVLYLFHIPLIHKRLHNLQDMERVIYLM
jgi:inorganic pyrophosphatase